MSRVTRLVPNILAGFMAVVFLDSLRFKFLNLPNTQVIFGKLDAWAASVGAPGLFAQTGLFSQYVIGSIELLAATLLVLGMLPRFRHLQAGGALAGVLVMTGAVGFHLFTPLGTDPNDDGGGLFIAACTNLAFGLLLLGVFRRPELGELVSRALAIFAPARAKPATGEPTAGARASGARLTARPLTSSGDTLVTAVWTDDFDFKWGSQGVDLRVRKTGADVRVDAAVLKDVAAWLAFYAPLRIKAVATSLLRPGPRIWFAPDRPRPWYLIWTVAAWGGIRFADSAESADAAFYFDDSTTSTAPAASGKLINFACTDVSKSRVAAVFEAVFGYPLSIDPETWTGLAVEKGEDNGAHDGQVVACPRPRRPGRVYQRVVDNARNGLVHDLRTPFVDGRPVLVFVKSRPLGSRFANFNTACRLTTPEAVFSTEEIERLSQFARAVNLDWGGLDVLRDRVSGRLYVVDVNKTDMGPPIALPWFDKLRAVRRLSRALLALISERTS